MRCLVCGSTKIDFESCKCRLCGAVAGLRDEECDVTEETKSKLWPHAQELSTFGVTLKRQDDLKKHIDPIEVISLALAVADSLDNGVLRKLVLFLRKLEIPQEEILRLRLAEPCAIAEILDDKDEGADAGQ
jgi:hypothetical protein